MTISHKIELIPNNKAKTHFKQAFGLALASLVLRKVIKKYGENNAWIFDFKRLFQPLV